MRVIVLKSDSFTVKLLQPQCFHHSFFTLMMPLFAFTYLGHVDKAYTTHTWYAVSMPSCESETFHFSLSTSLSSRQTASTHWTFSSGLLSPFPGALKLVVKASSRLSASSYSARFVLSIKYEFPHFSQKHSKWNRNTKNIIASRALQHISLTPSHCHFLFTRSILPRELTAALRAGRAHRRVLLDGLGRRSELFAAERHIALVEVPQHGHSNGNDSRDSLYRWQQWFWSIVRIQLWWEGMELCAETVRWHPNSSTFISLTLNLVGRDRHSRVNRRYRIERSPLLATHRCRWFFRSTRLSRAREEAREVVSYRISASTGKAFRLR